jgi:hypothetical protein
MGELKRDLIKALRQAHNQRVPRSKGQDRRGQIPDMVTSRHMRRIGLLHSLLCFISNTTVLALDVNMASSLI